MNLFSNIRRNLILYLAAAVCLGVVGSSCSGDEPVGGVEDRPGYTEGNDVWLALSVSQQRLGAKRNASRAAGDLTDPSGHPGEVATADENYINSTDLTLVILDRAGYAIKTIMPSDLTLTAIDGETDRYRVLTKLNRTYFDVAGESCYILAIANTGGMNRSDLGRDAFGTGIYMKSITQIGDMLQGFGYDGATAAGGTTPWLPSIDAGRHIPMAGLVKATLDATALDGATTPEAALNIGTINMQRSMARVQVLDGIAHQTAIKTPTHIESVRLCSGTGRGAYVPAVSQVGTWKEATAVVETATKPSPVGAWHNASLKFPTATGKITDTDDNVEYDAFICYTPEMAVADMKASATRPYLEIVTRDDNNETKTYTVYLDTAMTQRDIARNHIYQFVVTLSEQAMIQLDYTVCEWKTAVSGDISFN